MSPPFLSLSLSDCRNTLTLRLSYAPCYLSAHIIDLSLLFHTFVMTAGYVHVILAFLGLAF